MQSPESTRILTTRKEIMTDDDAWADERYWKSVSRCEEPAIEHDDE